MTRKNASSVTKNSPIHSLNRFGHFIRLKGISFFSRINIVWNAVRFGRENTSNKMTTRIGTIEFHGEVAKVEILLPSHLAKWIEAQSKHERMSPATLIKTWLVVIYNKHVEKVSR